MKINRKNYEKFAIDYIENNLNSDNLLEFEKFLQLNPDIKAEISEFQNSFFIEKEDVVFEDKFMLKQSPIKGLSYLDYLIISDIENTITKEEKQELNDFTNNNKQIINEYKTYSKTILHRKQAVFEDKDILKRTNRAVLTTIVPLAIAASLIIFIGIILKPDKFQNANSPYSFSVNFNSRNLVVPKVQNEKIRVKKNHPNIIDTNTIIVQQNNEINRNDVDEDFDLMQKNFKINSEQIVCNNIQSLRQETFYGYNRQKDLDIFKNINPIVVINTIFKGYETATENDNLNLKLAYNKNDKQVNFDYKNKVFELTMR